MIYLCQFLLIELFFVDIDHTIHLYTLNHNVINCDNYYRAIQYFANCLNQFLENHDERIKELNDVAPYNW